MDSPHERAPRRTLRALAVAVAIAVVATCIGAAGAAQRRPRKIGLPDGFRPEGIVTKGKRTFFVGSISKGAIYKGNLVSGRGAEFVPPQEGRAAIGLALGAGMIFVAGGPTGHAYVYDVDSGEEIADLQLTTEETFVNDVDAFPGDADPSKRAAYFTDSVNPVIYRLAIDGPKDVGAVETIPITGELTYQEGFNVNGIDVAPNGESVIVVQSNTGKLYEVDLSGNSNEIDLGGETVPAGDGILQDRGDRLWVLQNQQRLLTRIKLSPDLSSGTVESRKEIAGTDVPTTLDRSGDYLALVNARFGNESPDTADYWVTQIKRRR